ncbi:GAF domain-containing protein [Faecalibacillus faecis]|uniref:GAF domain-containing protein n=1 Tax=Faecalibacillus faecis TaxID=1982628 RepID=UPI00386DD1F8
MNNLLKQQYIGLIECNNEEISILANTSAFIMQNFDDISWAGFYLLKNEELILGPFQGKIACTNIPLTKGVCGKAASSRETVLVEDVHQFEGHIACDSESNSEIVVPLIKNNQLYGVLDLDSTSFSRFTKEDQVIFEEIAEILVQHL